MPISERVSSCTNKQSGFTRKEVSVLKSFTVITRSTMIMGARWGMSASISGNEACLFKVFCYDGTHFAAGDDLVLQGHLSAYQRYSEESLKNTEVGAELTARWRQLENFKVLNGPDVSYRWIKSA